MGEALLLAPRLGVFALEQKLHLAHQPPGCQAAEVLICMFDHVVHFTMYCSTNLVPSPTTSKKSELTKKPHAKSAKVAKNSVFHQANEANEGGSLCSLRFLCVKKSGSSAALRLGVFAFNQT